MNLNRFHFGYRHTTEVHALLSRFVFSLITNWLFIDLLDSDDGDAVLDSELRSLSLHELNNQENTNVEDEEHSDSSDEDGRLTHASLLRIDE